MTGTYINVSELGYLYNLSDLSCPCILPTLLGFQNLSQIRSFQSPQQSQLFGSAMVCLNPWSWLFRACCIWWSLNAWIYMSQDANQLPNCFTHWNRLHCDTWHAISPRYMFVWVEDIESLWKSLIYCPDWCPKEFAILLMRFTPEPAFTFWVAASCASSHLLFTKFHGPKFYICQMLGWQSP